MQREEAIKQAAKLYPEHILAPFGELLGHEGVDAIYAMCEVLGGDTVYIPTARHIFAGCIAEQLKQEYTGYNISALARKYGYNRKYVARLLEKNK